MMPHYQEVYGHVLRVTIQANQTNLILKKVTSWASTIAVPIVITGFYGQNLPYPAAGTQWAVLVSTALIKDWP